MRLSTMRSALVMLCACASSLAYAQESADALFHEVLDAYVAEGLSSNLALKSQHLEVQRAAQALAAARARFLPEISLEARYTRAEGGREFTLPLGTTLNPVYATLNEMLLEQGRPAQFPQISDATVRFLREKEQETRLVARQPLFAPAIPAAVRAQQALLDASDYNRMAFARALKRDITVAYIDWLKAVSAVEIVAASEALLAENVRVNASLHENGKITEDQVLRARAELLAVVQQKREAENQARQAQSWFNFLLNRELTARIERAAPPVERNESGEALEILWAHALDRRPELAQLERLRRASEEQARIARTQRWPTLSLALDGGLQGEGYGRAESDDFGTVSLVFTWRLFDGGADRARVREAQAAVRQLVLRREETAQQIRLEVQQAFDRLAAARDSLATAQARVEAARAGFRIASRKRDEGVISQVEFIDARSALTSAELNYNITRFDVLARRADLEYATSSGDLPLLEGV
jgi:outer membrane protein TolC